MKLYTCNGGRSSNKYDNDVFSSSFDKPLSEEIMLLISLLHLPLAAFKAIVQKAEENNKKEDWMVQKMKMSYFVLRKTFRNVIRQ